MNNTQLFEKLRFLRIFKKTSVDTNSTMFLATVSYDGDNDGIVTKIVDVYGPFETLEEAVDGLKEAHLEDCDDAGVREYFEIYMRKPLSEAKSYLDECILYEIKEIAKDEETVELNKANEFRQMFQ